jgi:hypothetical protein
MREKTTDAHTKTTKATRMMCVVKGEGKVSEVQEQLKKCFMPFERPG